MAAAMRVALALLLAAPAAAQERAAHSGTTVARTAPELSDLALFGMAAAGVVLARRALRARFRRKD